MDNFQLFYQIKSVHEPLVWLSFLFVIISDLYGSLWVLGRLPKLNLKALVWLHRIVFVGLGALILSGLSMVFLNSEEFLTNYVFWIKMFFVAVLFWNAGRIGDEISIPAKKTFAELDMNQKRKMLMVGATSIISWVSIFILAGML